MDAGTLTRPCRPETTVLLCSDHGSNRARSVLVALRVNRRGRRHGTGSMVSLSWLEQESRRDERIYGASLIDIAPTVLTLFDLPIGQDMDGRPCWKPSKRFRR